MSNKTLKTHNRELISILLVYEFTPTEIQWEGPDDSPYVFYFDDSEAKIIATAYEDGEIEKLNDNEVFLLDKVIEEYLWQWIYKFAWQENDAKRSLEDELQRLKSINLS